MRGQYNNRLLNGAKFLGAAKTKRALFMFDGGFPRVADLTQLDRFPVLQGAAQSFAGQVAGELFRVSDATLQSMDRLEGTPHHYTRERIPVLLYDGRETNAFVYRICKPETYFKFLKPVPPVQGVINWKGPDYARAE